MPFAADPHNVTPLDLPRAQRDSFGENRDESALTALHYTICFRIFPHNITATRKMKIGTFHVYLLANKVSYITPFIIITFKVITASQIFLFCTSVPTLTMTCKRIVRSNTWHLGKLFKLGQSRENATRQPLTALYITLYGTNIACLFVQFATALFL